MGTGTGLGLSACYGIVQDHKGEIVCENLGNGGAKFTVMLPAMEAVRKPPTGVSVGESVASRQ